MTNSTNNPRYSPRSPAVLREEGQNRPALIRKSGDSARPSGLPAGSSAKAGPSREGGPRRFGGQRRTYGPGQTGTGASHPKPAGYGRQADRTGRPAYGRTAGRPATPSHNDRGGHGFPIRRPLPSQIRPIENRQNAEIKKSALRIIPLGGLEEVGCNMMIYEYGNDILIIDVGLQFPNEDMPGIDFIIPNISYLKGKEKNIRGVIITHGHYDHLGAIPYLIEKLGYPTIYTMPLTRGIILKRQEDFKNLKPLDIETVGHDTVLKLGAFKVEFIHLNHNIPDAVGLAIRTPEGILLHATDYKFDPTPVNDKPADFAKIAKL
ncbi:MAG: MBL fold metallo-hydrolase, partial [Patescibacteria group bacterium]